MKCMCAQTRPRFILSSEGVLEGMEFEPMLTPREKSPLPENVPRGGSNPRHCGQRAQALPTELFRPAPPPTPPPRLNILLHKPDRRPVGHRAGRLHVSTRRITEIHLIRRWIKNCKQSKQENTVIK